MRHVTQPYIGGIFAANDDEAFIRAGCAQEYFPATTQGLQRVLFETGADAMAWQIKCFASGYTGGVELWLPDNFCQETVDKLLIKCGGTTPPIHIKHYLIMEEAFAYPAARSVVLLHRNRYDATISQAAAKYRDVPNALIIEDFVQAPFEVAKVRGHCGINSLRKICALEAAVTYMPQDPGALQKGSDYLQLKREAMTLREVFLKTGDAEAERLHLEKARDAQEAANNPAIYRADDLAEHHFAEMDFAAIREKRTQNREFLENALRGNADIEILPSDYFFLMVRMAQRDAVRKALFAKGIFPPIHWDDSRSKASLNLLSLPIDQRYGAADMQRLAAALIQTIEQIGNQTI